VVPDEDAFVPPATFPHSAIVKVSSLFMIISYTESVMNHLFFTPWFIIQKFGRELHVHYGAGRKGQARYD
jgi:hypothetical protein